MVASHLFRENASGLGIGYGESDSNLPFPVFHPFFVAEHLVTVQHRSPFVSIVVHVPENVPPKFAFVAILDEERNLHSEAARSVHHDVFHPPYPFMPVTFSLLFTRIGGKRTAFPAWPALSRLMNKTPHLMPKSWWSTPVAAGSEKMSGVVAELGPGKPRLR